MLEVIMIINTHSVKLEGSSGVTYASTTWKNYKAFIILAVDAIDTGNMRVFDMNIYDAFFSPSDRQAGSQQITHFERQIFDRSCTRWAFGRKRRMEHNEVMVNKAH